MHILTLKIAFTYSVVLSLLSSQANAEESPKPAPIRVTADNRTGLALTLYHGKTALVADQRKFTLASGKQRIRWEPVSSGIQPETALFTPIGGSKSFKLIDQSFQDAWLTSRAALLAAEGTKVIAVRTHPTSGAETETEAILLSARDGLVLQIGNRIETQFPGRIVLPFLPAGAPSGPAFTLELHGEADGAREAELRYLTNGLGWSADYVAQLNAGNDKLDMTAYATLRNETQTVFPGATLKLVAGTVHRERAQNMRAESKMMMAREGMQSDAQAEPAPQPLGDYHVYDLAGRFDIAPRETRQVVLASASQVPCRKEYRLVGQPTPYPMQVQENALLRPQIWIVFKNEAASHLGVPLPPGIFRVYQADRSGASLFAGEDSFQGSAKNEEASVQIGEAFDLSAERKQTSFELLPPPNRRDQRGETSISEYSIELRNGSDKDATVQVRELIPGDWEILSESAKHEKADSQTAVWKLKVKAEGKSVLTYRVKIRQ